MENKFISLLYPTAESRELHGNKENLPKISESVCEELGLVGAILIIALFSVMILRGYWIALRASDRFSTVLAAGLVTLIAVQTVLNLGVVTNLLPSTGIALPFFSYGGTALAVNLGEMGVVLSVSRQRNETKDQEVLQ